MALHPQSHGKGRTRSLGVDKTTPKTARGIPDHRPKGSGKEKGAGDRKPKPLKFGKMS